MKYIDADKIRAEIERRKGYISVTHFVEDLLSFLDTLEEQECPEYCVRSHCIGCSKYNPDEWSNKPRKARVKATGEIVEGFTDGQGHFDVFTDHNICNRYDVSAVEFDTLEEPVSEDLEEAAEEYSGDPNTGFIDMTAYRAFKAGAEWQKAKMMEGVVEAMVTTNLANRPAIYLDQLEGFQYGDKVRVIIVKEDEK